MRQSSGGSRRGRVRSGHCGRCFDRSRGNCGCFSGCWLQRSRRRGRRGHRRSDHRSRDLCDWRDSDGSGWCDLRLICRRCHCSRRGDRCNIRGRCLRLFVFMLQRGSTGCAAECESSSRRRDSERWSHAADSSTKAGDSEARRRSTKAHWGRSDTKAGRTEARRSSRTKARHRAEAHCGSTECESSACPRCSPADRACCCVCCCGHIPRSGCFA